MAGSSLEERADRELEAVRRAGDPVRPFTLRPASELIAEPAAPDWLVHGILERGSVAMLFGPSGSGKSFAAIDVGASIASGTPWHGRAVAAGPVIYLCGEGHRGVRRRILAWSIARKVPMDGVPLFVSDAAIALSNPLEAHRVTEAVEAIAARTGQRPQAIVVDTLARHYAGDESSAEEIGQLLSTCDEFLRTPFGAAIVLIHHTGHQSQERARGSSALRAALDAEYQVTRQDRSVLVSCTKAKDTEPPEAQAFEICTVELPWLGDDGQPCTSAVLRPTAAPERAPVPTTGNQGKAIAALQRLTTEQADRLSASGHDPTSARVSLVDWREASGIDRKRWAEVFAALTNSGRVVHEPPYVRLG